MSSTDLLVEPSRQSRGQRALSTVLRSRELSIALVLLLIVVAATTKRHTFVFSHDGWRDTLLAPSILLLLAIGQMVVIVTRNVDLSVGSTLGVTAYVTGKIFIANPDTPVVLVFVVGLLVGAALGAVNGFLVAFFRVPALVVTLGTMYVFRGYLTNKIGNGRIVAGDFPANFEKLGTQQVLTIPLLTIIGLV
ncbi:MAG: ABC transporter permease, partial [Nocardioides sp.]